MAFSWCAFNRGGKYKRVVSVHVRLHNLAACRENLLCNYRGLKIKQTVRDKIEDVCETKRNVQIIGRSSRNSHLVTVQRDPTFLSLGLETACKSTARVASSLELQAITEQWPGFLLSDLTAVLQPVKQNWCLCLSCLNVSTNSAF